MDAREEQKKQAALVAVREVRSGMRLGLGTGSTSRYAVIAIGEAYQRGELNDIVGVATSNATAELATSYGIPLTSISKLGEVDLAIDGADEVDPVGDLIKGGGGALLREKEVEARAKRFVVIVDDKKLSPRLGTIFALPVEVEQKAWRGELEYLASLGSQATRRGGDAPFVTDNGNYIVDARFASGIADARALGAQLDARAAVRAHGLFLGMASVIVIAGAAGVDVRIVR